MQHLRSDEKEVSRNRRRRRGPFVSHGPPTAAEGSDLRNSGRYKTENRSAASSMRALRRVCSESKGRRRSLAVGGERMPSDGRRKPFLRRDSPSAEEAEIGCEPKERPPAKCVDGERPPFFPRIPTHWRLPATSQSELAIHRANTGSG